MHELVQDLFHLRYHVAFICEGYLKPNFRTNNVTRPAEVRDDRNGADCQSFKNYASHRNREPRETSSHPRSVIAAWLLYEGPFRRMIQPPRPQGIW